MASYILAVRSCEHVEAVQLRKAVQLRFSFFSSIAAGFLKLLWFFFSRFLPPVLFLLVFTIFFCFFLFWSPLVCLEIFFQVEGIL